LADADCEEGRDARGEQGRILVVEDSPEQRTVLSELLRELGYASVSAATCGDGREAFQPGKFGCALVDLGLPDGRGQDLVAEFLEGDPLMVPVILTGDSSAETVIETMRIGAFDYLTKPVDFTTLKAALARAMAHHEAIRERSVLVQLLFEEREQLKARVEAATADIREYAVTCEKYNEQLQALLRLTQAASGLSTDERLFRKVFEEIGRYLPVECIALCDSAGGGFLAAYRPEADSVAVVVAEIDGSESTTDSLLATVEPELLVRTWVERHTALDAAELEAYTYPQVFWNRPICIIGVLLAPAFRGTEKDREFLGMCAHFIASAWQQGHLLQHAAQHASLGNIALELSRSFLQNLTAIRTSTDLLQEMATSQEVSEGLAIIAASVESLRRQTQDFRRLSMRRGDSIETVDLERYIDQALDMLSFAVQKKGVRLVKDFEADSECVLLNGNALARTFLDLIANALRAASNGSELLLRLRDTGERHILFEIALGARRSKDASVAGAPARDAFLSIATESHPGFLLAQRTVHSCGGKLTVEVDETSRPMFRILLPRNAAQRGALPEVPA